MGPTNAANAANTAGGTVVTTVNPIGASTSLPIAKAIPLNGAVNGAGGAIAEAVSAVEEGSEKTQAVHHAISLLVSCVTQAPSMVREIYRFEGVGETLLFCLLRTGEASVRPNIHYNIQCVARNMYTEK
jgi:hypothetical protein